jgi:hypothetical protein
VSAPAVTAVYVRAEDLARIEVRCGIAWFIPPHGKAYRLAQADERFDGAALAAGWRRGERAGEASAKVRVSE